MQNNTHRLKLFVILVGLYLAQGIPIYLIAAALPPVLRDHGVSKTAIGFLALLMLPMVLKFIWAPIIDRFGLMNWGHRRGWILPMQCLIVVGLTALAFINPTDIYTFFGICLIMSVAISTQDVATDGYATLKLRPQDRAIGNGIQGGSIAAGVLIGGTLALVLFERLGWRSTMLIMAGLSALPVIVTIMMNDDPMPAKIDKDKPSLRDFFARPEAVLVFIFALVYRASEGLVKAMEGPYLLDAGLPLSWIGYISGGAAATAGIIGSISAAWLIRRRGAGVVLIWLGILRSICFLIFALHAAETISGPIPAIAASGLQTFVRYMEIVALYSVFMAVSSSRQPGTDFTILSSAQLIIYLIGSSLAGLIADAWGYALLFNLATILSISAVFITWHLLRRIPKKIS